MELKIWVPDDERGEVDEETVLRTIAENAEEWYAKAFGGILETEIDGVGTDDIVPGTISVHAVSIDQI